MTITTTTTTTKVETVVVKKSSKKEAPATVKVEDVENTSLKEKAPSLSLPPTPENAITVPLVELLHRADVAPAATDDPNTSDPSTDRLRALGRIGGFRHDGTLREAPSDTQIEKGKVAVPHDDEDSVYVGLRVYSQKDVPVVVVGRLKPVVPSDDQLPAAT